MERSKVKLKGAKRKGEIQKDYTLLSYIVMGKTRDFNLHGFLCSHEGWNSALMFQENCYAHTHGKTWSIINNKSNERCQH